MICLGLAIFSIIFAQVFPDANTSNDTYNGSTYKNDHVTTDGNSSLVVRVMYSKPWRGTISDGKNLSSFSEMGYKTYKIHPDAKRVSVSVTKKDNSSSKLRVEIRNNGKIVASGDTKDSYGFVNVDYLK